MEYVEFTQHSYIFSQLSLNYIPRGREVKLKSNEWKYCPASFFICRGY